MQYLTHLTLGFLMSGTALLLPGMVNMTVVSVSMKQGLREGILFSIGAAFVMLIQAYLAITFAGYLDNNPEIFLFLKRLAVVLFLVLSMVFLYLGLRPRPRKSEDSSSGNKLLMGGVLTAMNALNLPFYFTASTYLNVKGLIDLEAPHHWFLLIGAFLGAQSMLLGFAYFAQLVASKAERITRYFHFILSGLFLVLAFMQLVDLYFE